MNLVLWGSYSPTGVAEATALKILIELAKIGFPGTKIETKIVLK